MRHEDSRFHSKIKVGSNDDRPLHFCAIIACMRLFIPRNNLHCTPSIGFILSESSGVGAKDIVTISKLGIAKYVSIQAGPCAPPIAVHDSSNNLNGWSYIQKRLYTEKVSRKITENLSSPVST